MPQQNRRKTYLINPRFQWRFIGFMAIVALLAISILSSQSGLHGMLKVEHGACHAHLA